MNSSRFAAFALVAFAALTPTGTAPAHTIEWGGALLFDDWDSGGVALDTVTYTFSIGTFGNSAADLSDGNFDPSLSNAADWATNWKELDSTAYNQTFKWFTSSVDITDNSTFAVGEKAYIWVYNSTTPSTSTEWFMVSNLNGAAWIIPDTNPIITPATFEWRLTFADTAVFGRLEQHDALNNPTGVLTGEGEHSFDPSSTYEVQTFTFAPAVPEPGTALFLGLGLLLTTRRRR